MILRRLGPSRVALCSGGHGCPDVLELDSGDFAVIGADITDQARNKLPPGCGCSDAERIIRVPRATLVGVRSYIPAS